MKNMKSYVLAMACTFTGMAAYAAEGGQSVSLAFIGNIADAKLPENIDNGNPNVNKDNKFGWGGGLLFGHPMGQGFGLEVGALLVNRHFEYDGSGYKFEQSQWTIQVPVMAKVTMVEFLSLGIGPFLSFPVGDAENKFSVGNSSAGFNWEREKNNELGLTAAVGVNLPISTETALFVEARYNYGLTSLNKPDDDAAMTNDLQGLAGIRFAL